MKSLKKLLIGLFALSALSLMFVSCPREPEENVEVASVTFDPNSDSIKPGATVSLSTTTEGAEIYYSKNLELTSSNFTEGTQGTSVQITNDGSTESETIHAIAVFTSSATGKTYTSQPSSKTYSILKVPGKVKFTPEAGIVTSGTKVKLDATSPIEGDTVTIWYSLGTALTDINYEIVGIKYDDTSEGFDGIEVTSATTIYAIAVGQNGSGAVSSASYSLPLTKLTVAPEADDVVYIYYPTRKSVMLSTASGSELSKADVTLDESGSFTTTDSMAALTVFKNEIGQYVFVSGGKYLTTTTRNNLTLSDTFSVFALWEVEAISEGSNTFYIHSANSIYNNTRQGLEYYNNKFSAYDRKTQEIYQFQFYKDPSKASELNAEAKASLALQANSLATPTFSLTGGDENPVVAGTKIFLSSLSLDVDFYYTTDGSDITGENYGTKISTDPPTAYKYDASQGIAIEGSQGETRTINAIAVKTVASGSETRGIFSLPASAVYTLGEDTNTYLSKVTTLADNDVVVIYLPSGKTTISSATSGKGFSGTSATESTKGLVLSDSLTQFTVKKLGESGYVFVNGGKYLSFDGKDSMVLADAFTDNSVWTLEQAGSSTDSFYIKNAGDSTKYIEFYNVFTVYSFQSDKAAIYTFQFYKNESGTPENVTLSVLPVSFSVPGGVVKADTPIALTSKTPDANIYWQWKTDSSVQ